MQEITLIQFIAGLVAIAIWAYILFCIAYRRILVDRILALGKYWHIAIIFLLVMLVPMALTTVAYLCGMHNYDLLFNSALYTPEDALLIKNAHADAKESPSLFTTILFQFRGFGSHFYAGTEQGKVWALVISMLGTMLFSGLLIPSVLSIIRMRSENYKWGNTRYNIQRSPYAVILGAHEAVPELIRQILSPTRSQRIRYVIVQTTQNVLYYRQDLKNHISKAEMTQTILYSNGRTTPQHLKPLHLERAREVYVLGEANESDADHDSTNLQCLRTIAQLLKESRRRERLQCYVLFEHQSTFTAFQHSDLTQMVRDQIEFISLNFYEMWAQNTLNQLHPIDNVTYLPLEGKHRIDKQSRKHVHFIIVGMSRMGIALARQAANMCHFPNHTTQGIRTRITFIDAYADTEKDTFISSYPSLFQLCRWRVVHPEQEEPTDDATPWTVPTPDPMRDTDFLDIDWEFVHGRLESPGVRQWLCQAVCQPDAISTVAICFHQPQLCQTAAIYLPTDVYRHAEQILVYQRNTSEIVSGLAGLGNDEAKRQNTRYQKLRPFGMIDKCFSQSIVDYRLAKLVNYVYWRPEDTSMDHVNDPDPDHENLPLQESFWRQGSVADQWSSNYNAGAVATKLRFLGLDILQSPIEEIEALFRDEEIQQLLTEVEHNRWNTEKLLSGFRHLTNDEWQHFTALRQQEMPYKQYAREKKLLQTGWEKAHLDICSMHDLEVVDQPSIAYDLILAKAFPAIVRVLRREEEAFTAPKVKGRKMKDLLLFTITSLLLLCSCGSGDMRASRYMIESYPTIDVSADLTPEWLSQERQLTTDYYSHISYMKQVEDRFDQLNQYRRPTVMQSSWGRCFYTERRGSMPKEVLYVRETLNSPDEVFFDPNHSHDGHSLTMTSYHLSIDGKYATISVRYDNDETQAILVFDVATRAVIDREIIRGARSAVHCWAQEGFYYVAYEDNTPDATQEIKFHRIGTTEAEDRVVIPPSPMWCEYDIRNYGTEGDKIFLLRYTGNRFNQLYLLKAGTDSLQIICDIPGTYAVPVAIHFDRLLVWTNHHAPMGQVVSLPLNYPDINESQTIVAEAENEIIDAAAGNGQLIISYLCDGSSQPVVFTTEGQRRALIRTPGYGTAKFICSLESEMVFYLYQSLSQPTTMYKYDCHTNTSVLFEAPTIDFDAEQYDTQRVNLKLRSGQSATLFYVHRKGLKHNGQAPCMLRGITETDVYTLPEFNFNSASVLERNGVYAQICCTDIEQGMEAACEYLINEGITQPTKLGVTGFYEAAAPVASLASRRPDLFSVGILYAPKSELDLPQDGSATFPAMLVIGNIWDPGLQCHANHYIARLQQLHTGPEAKILIDAEKLMTGQRNIYCSAFSFFWYNVGGK